MTWTWQDEAWRFYNASSNLAYSSSYLAQNVMLRLQAQAGQTPPEDDDGGSGVREPRRPAPHAPAGSMALVLA